MRLRPAVEAMITNSLRRHIVVAMGVELAPNAGRTRRAAESNSRTPELIAGTTPGHLTNQFQPARRAAVIRVPSLTLNRDPI